MSKLDDLILKIKRGETPAYRAAKRVLKKVAQPSGVRIPAFARPLFRFLYEAHFGLIIGARWFATTLYRHPLFQGRCASIGRNLRIDVLPFISGHVEIHIGDDVWLGKISVDSGRMIDRPQLIIKDRSEIGWGVRITVSKEVLIEEDVRVSFDCRISDTDGHPREADLRAQHAPPAMEDIRPVRICRYAWIGNGSHIMKGVTIGEGAIIAANSVVISDIPPYSLAMGNPAEVYFRNFGRPSKKNASAAGAPES